MILIRIFLRKWSSGCDDVIFVDVLMAVCDKMPMFKMLVSVEADILFNVFGKENIKKRAITLVNILSCAVKDTVCTHGVMRAIERVNEFGIQEMREKYLMCMQDQMDVGT